MYRFVYRLRRRNSTAAPRVPVSVTSDTYNLSLINHFHIDLAVVQVMYVSSST